jgi:glycosyltransferase involved in cell wall biosynthesis
MTEAPAQQRPRVLQMGPDPRIGGGMAAALRGLLASPLAERYRLEVVPTYRDPRPLPRLALFALALLRLAAWSLRGRGRIVHVHATVRGSLYRKSVCVLLARALRRRVVLHVHSGAGDIAAFRAGLNRPSRSLFDAAFAAADRVLAVSEASREALREAYGLGAVEVVPNAAPLVDPPRREPVGDGHMKLAYLGGFANPAKGGDVLVEALAQALAQVPGLRVTLAGPGELPEEGRAMVARFEGRVEWAGWLDEPSKDALLREADAFVMPSRSEGMPMALLEALAYRLAVVATEAGGIPEIVRTGETGILVPGEDPAALADGIERLAADPLLIQRLAEAGRRRVESLDAVEVAGRLDALYSSLL